MAKKPKRRSKHIPRRTCVGCREVLAKRALIRIVKGPEGVAVDLTGKAHGRGAYLHDKRSCWMRGINGGLAHAFGAILTDQEKQDLSAYMENQFPEERVALEGDEELSR